MAGKQRAPSRAAGPSNNKNPKQALGKGKTVGEPTGTEPTAEVIVEDNMDQRLEEAYLGTVVVDVRNLTTHWGRKEKRTQSLQPTLVARLKEASKHGIKRDALEDCLKATIEELDLVDLRHVHNRVCGL